MELILLGEFVAKANLESKVADCLTQSNVYNPADFVSQLKNAIKMNPSLCAKVTQSLPNMPVLIPRLDCADSMTQS